MSTDSDVRMGFINTTNHTKKYFIEGTRFKVAAIDGQSVHKPQELENTKLELGAGGRYDVMFTMPEKPVLIKTSGYSQHGKTGAQLLLSQDDQGSIPLISAKMPSFRPEEYGESLQTPFDLLSHFDREIIMILGQRFGFYDGKPNYLWTINGEVFPNAPTLMVKEGDLVKITFVNKNFMDHPMHLHGHRMLVLSKNGKPVTGNRYSERKHLKSLFWRTIQVCGWIIVTISNMQP
ncbi:multicopper oxidase domain-containing protein [Peribacillus loiseleuriae]|uniref:multicopper oxidase domain-containing protein n=1 Tax=Peribacillus loiseleuriae TaxID=1679170 RepID=UPI00067115BC|nr:multicopper oxidase domain-containing protein [Peribacillus loiseleuriae]